MPAATLALVRQPDSKQTPMEDPAEKPGLIGAFCRVFVPSDLAELLPGMFERGRDERHFSWIDGEHAPDGVYITTCGHGLVSVHNTAPTGQARRVNIFDFVRLHLFDYLDSDAADDVPMSQRPSFKAIREWIANNCPEVLDEMATERSTAEDDFQGLDDGADGDQPGASDDPEAVIMALRQMPGAEVTRAWVAMAITLRADHASMVVEEVHRLTGLGKRGLNAALKEARDEAARQREAAVVSTRAGPRARRIYKPEDQTEHAREIEAAVVARALPGEYVSFAGVLSSVTVKELPFTHLIKHKDRAPPPVPQLEPLDHVAMLAKAEEVVVLLRETKIGPKPMGIPQQIVKILLNKQVHVAPMVTGLLTHPIVLPGTGEILQEDGLHPASGLFLSSSVKLDVRPYTQAQATEALDRLRKAVLVGFEFATPMDADAAVAGLITGVQRRVLDMAPGLAVIAPMQSSGKTTLARRIHIILTGHDMPVSSFPEGDEAELQKRLLAALLRSPAMICFDNLTDGTTFRSPAVAAAITGPVLVQRVLGVSREAKCPTNVLMALTGNNLSLGADEVTRWLTVRLGASTPQSEQRLFEHPDVLAHGLDIRVGVLTDVLGIVAGFLASRTALQTRTRFPKWDGMVRQPMIWAGGADMAEVFAGNAAASEDAQAQQGLMEVMLEVFQSGEFSASDVVRCAHELDKFAQWNSAGRPDFNDANRTEFDAGQATRRDQAERQRASLGALRTKRTDSEASVGRALKAGVGRPVRIGEDGERFATLQCRTSKGYSKYWVAVTG